MGISKSLCKASGVSFCTDTTNFNTISRDISAIHRHALGNLFNIEAKFRYLLLLRQSIYLYG